MAKLYSPNGAEIIGTSDIIPATARIINSGVTQNADGTFEFGWSDAGTDVHWDDQETVTENGERLFVDDAGETWRESELVLEDEDEDEEELEDAEA